MQPNYENWVPKKLKYALLASSIVLALALVAFVLLMTPGVAKTVLLVVLIILLVVVVMLTQWSFMAYNAFSYTGKRKLSKQIVEGTAGYVQVPRGGVCLDVGCGSGALTIAVAKRNSEARVVGCDRWGKDYSDFSRQLCEKNALAEGVTNATFEPGDATRLPFDDETFDAVTSNYVYHNISGRNKQELLLETLRTLKKGGTFAIHDLMSKVRYGNMQDFVKKLRDMGYQEVELIDTTNGQFMTKAESRRYMLVGSTILRGVK